MKKVGSYALLISMLSGCSQQNTVNQTESEVSEAQMQENSENIETEKMQDTEKIQNTEKIQDTEKNENTEKLSPFEMHGALHVENGKLTDQHGDVVQLYGMSTHGIAWFPQYVNRMLFAHFGMIGIQTAYVWQCIRRKMEDIVLAEIKSN